MYFQKARAYLILVLVLAFAYITFEGWHWGGRARQPRPLRAQLTSNDVPIFSKDVRNVFKPLIISPSGTFYDKAANQYHAIDTPIWSRMGHEVCIADIDTRAFDKPGQLLSSDFRWSDTDNLSAGLLNHFLYATIHGYSYHFINAQQWPNEERANSWTRVTHIRLLLETCRFVVVVDNDAVFQHLELPFEWLLNRWNFTKEHSMAMPYDTSTWVNDEGVKLLDIPDMHDSKGLLTINDGVIIAQSLPRTKDMVDAWEVCPDDEERFPGCSIFARKWPNDQGAFGEYIRHEFDRPTDFLAVPCDDANGFPGQHMNCSGVFLRHYTTDKPAAKANVGDTLLDALTKVFAAQFDQAKHVGQA